MASICVIGAGVTGAFTAARFHEKGGDVSLLVRGNKADRIERDGLRLRDGISGEERTIRVPVVRAPITRAFDLVMICAQFVHHEEIENEYAPLPGQPAVWYLGNRVAGYDRAGDVWGRHRVVGGFPGVGGTWDGDVLVYADRSKLRDKPFDRLVAGEAFPEARAATDRAVDIVSRLGFSVERYDQIMAWHLCHVALILPLAGVYYRHDGVLDTCAADTPLLRSAIRALRQGLRSVRRNGLPILPRSLRIAASAPAWLGAAKMSRLLRSRFGAIALAGHAQAARAEMRALAAHFLNYARRDDGHRAHITDLVDLLDSI